MRGTTHTDVLSGVDEREQAGLGSAPATREGFHAAWGSRLSESRGSLPRIPFPGIVAIVGAAFVLLGLVLR